MIIDDETYFAHYGILRKSGRYPWNSGETQSERNRTFLDMVENLKRQGLSEVEIARGFSTEDYPFTVSMLRNAKSIAVNEERQAKISEAQRLRDHGHSHVEIGKRMGGLNESSVRSLLNPSSKDRTNVLQATSSMLRHQLDLKKYIDVGTGVERSIGVSRNQLDTAIALLKEEDYKMYYLKVPQIGVPGNFTTVKVLTKPGISYSEVFNNQDQIKQINEYSEDGGRTFEGIIKPPTSIDSKRVAIRYAEDGGTDSDGVIYVRRGVEDISLGKSSYAQVRIAVDGTHYLKGMAMYKDDLPKGVDLMFNTSKSDTGDKFDAMKKMETTSDGKIDKDNPFGSTINRQSGVMNVLNEEGTWFNWSRTLSSQMLSKQNPKLITQQLKVNIEKRRKDLEEIAALTNPVVKKKLLETFAEETDTAAVHLKAAALPNSINHVILPIPSIKPTEIYAPNYKNGQIVVLIRHPHGGTFEIPKLVVNNNHSEAKKVLGLARDAVGIHPDVAVKLSGADFDGDHVLVIPDDRGQIKVSDSLSGLKNFDARREYPGYEGMTPMKPKTKQHQMGVVSNLITDMTLHGASTDELARAIRHSMVVIDSEKHNLNYKQSAINNGINQLKAKYQTRDGTRKGASTLISLAGSDVYIPERKNRSAAKGGPIDKITGKRMYEPTNKEYINKEGKIVPSKEKVQRLAITDDALTLSSGTKKEKIYAEYSNTLKNMANEARLLSVHTKVPRASESAKKIYANEVATLNASLNTALKNAPRERQALLLARAVVSQKKQANPNMEPEDLKKIRSQALTEMRIRTGAHKERIDITPGEWAAIQAGAISPNKLRQILNNADLKQIKQLATPKTKILMTSAKTARAQSMIASGYTQAEVAAALGVSLTTLKDSLD